MTTMYMTESVYSDGISRGHMTHQTGRSLIKFVWLIHDHTYNLLTQMLESRTYTTSQKRSNQFYSDRVQWCLMEGHDHKEGGGGLGGGKEMKRLRLKAERTWQSVTAEENCKI